MDAVGIRIGIRDVASAGGVASNLHDDCGRMGGEDKHIGIQIAYHADKLLLPFDVQASARP